MAAPLSNRLPTSPLLCLTMPCHPRVFAFIFLALLICLPARAADPLATVREFCRIDGAGHRLSPSTWPKIAPLVGWEIDPAWDRILVINGYEIGTPRRDGEEVLVEITYKITSEIRADRISRQKRQESITLRLARDPSDAWHIIGAAPVPHVFDSFADAKAIAALLGENSSYESASRMIHQFFQEDGRDIPFTPVRSIPSSPHFDEVSTAQKGDLALYYANGEPYHVGWVESETHILSATMNAGRQLLPFAAFGGTVRYFRVRRDPAPSTPSTQPARRRP